MSVKITRNRIKAAADCIAEAVNPERIMLFGSYAYGRPTQDSDVDFLLVVHGWTKKERREAYLKASKALHPRPFPVDIVVRNFSDIRTRIKQGDCFLQEIIEKGLVLYEK